MQIRETSIEQGLVKPTAEFSSAQRRIVLGLVAGLMLLATTILAPTVELRSLATGSWTTCYLAVWLGGLAAFSSLVALWAALAGQPLLVRGCRAFGFATLLFFALVWALSDRLFTASYATATAVVGLALVSLQTLVFAALRGLFRWRLELATPEASPTIGPRPQFTLWQALVWTTAAAGLLALFQCVPLDRSVLSGAWLDQLASIVIFILTITVPTAVAGLGSLLGRSRRVRFTAVLAILVLVTTNYLIAGQTISLARAVSWQEFRERTLMLQFQASFLAVYLGTLAVARLAGYRVARRPRAGSAPLALPTAPPTAEDERCSQTRARFAFLVTGLLLLAGGFGVLAIPLALAGLRCAAAVKREWERLNVDVHLVDGRVDAVCFSGHGAFQEAALRKLAEVEASYATAAPGNSPGFTLEFVGVPLTDSQLQHLRGLAHLRGLVLLNTRVTDAGLPHLERLPSLESLTLSGKAITDAGLACLARFPALTSLDLAETTITSVGFAHLERMTGLTSLGLYGSECGDADLARLSRLTKLESLGVGHTRITDAGLKHLAGLPQLEFLDLTETSITDAGLQEVMHCPQLRRLELVGTAISDNGLQWLDGLPQLQRVSLGPSVTRAAAVGLKQKHPRCEIFYDPNAPGLAGEMSEVYP